MKVVRCAIYTRKSSDEGLEQDFNSLDAQREACAAYVLSQASEGWQLLPTRYDDGGLSGGTLKRPALQQLLADVADGQVDTIVVYKVDRLTRSLLDFAKLVEALDQAGTSFVSITQSFNTTTSMGRLTLNMLLSFAQFEREVTAERIRDKIAASKAKGMWMGGTPPLGYRPDGRSLAIVDEHAAIIRNIYDRYLAYGSVRDVAKQLKAEEIRAPRRQHLSGMSFGGVPFTRGQLYSILKNAIYIGDIVHKEHIYAGQHPPIIAREEWDKVQQMLAEHVRGQRKHREATNALLAGKLLGPNGEQLISAHSTKRNVRYRYYVSHDLHHGDGEGVRLPAGEIEGLVVGRVALLFNDPIGVIDQLHLDVEPMRMNAAHQLCAELTVALKGTRRREIIPLVREVRVHERHVELDIDTAGVAELIGFARNPNARPTLTLVEQVRLTRTGRVLRLLDQSDCAATAATPDEALLKMLCKARGWWAILSQGSVNIDALAESEHVTASWMTRVLRLAFLSPALVDAILQGKLNPGIGSRALIQPGAIPASWSEQQASYLPPQP